MLAKIQQVLLRPSVFILVVANLFPIYGAVVFGWEVFPIIFLFWLENIIIGFFNVLRLLWVSPEQPLKWLAKVFMIPFFCFHYGMFCFIHGIFVIALFGKNYLPLLKAPQFSQVLPMLFSAEKGLFYAVLALFLSHGFSFVDNYLGKKEYQTKTIDTLMSQPYLRVVILHLTILLGGFLIMIFKQPTLGLILLLLLKISVDLKAHLHEHKINV